MGSHKLHHYVPRFYLQGFADRAHTGSVWVYEKGASAPRRQGVYGTAAETYYYAIETPSGEREVFLETQYLAPIESAAAPVIEYLRSARKPAIEPKHAAPLASFLTTLYARSPFARRAGESIFLGLAIAGVRRQFQDTSAIEAFLSDNPEVPISVAGVRKILADLDDPKEWSLSLRRGLPVALQFLHVGSFYPYFKDKNISLLVGSGNPEFVTCDSPLSVFDLDSSGRACVGLGIGRPNVEIVLPLSPVRALRLTYKATPSTQRVSARLTDDINRRLVYQAARYVYASRDSKRIHAFVSSWFAKRQKLTIDPVAMDAYARRFGPDSRK